MIDALAAYATTITSSSSTITAVVSEYETTDPAGSTHTAETTSTKSPLPEGTTTITSSSSTITFLVSNESVGSIDGNTNRSRTTSTHATLANDVAPDTTTVGESDTARVLLAYTPESTTLGSSIAAATGFSASSISVNNPKQSAGSEYSTTALTSSTVSGIIYQAGAPSMVMRKSLKALMHCLLFVSSIN